MGTEIERKFRVRDLSWQDDADPGTRIWQGYLSTTPERTVRVRLKGERAYLTVKGITRGAARAEYEYDIPTEDARDMLRDLCQQPTIDKVRYLVQHEGFTWEVDVFARENEGLVVAEVELDSEDQQPPLPPWVGAEVTEDPRYYNANLIAYPYTAWDQQP